MTQTLTTKERLKPFEDENYLLHQPHLKVIRIFNDSKENKTIITTYYPSGHIYQHLECKNNQAYGTYKEWGPRGQIKVKASVTGGAPELDPEGMSTWIFDGENTAYDDDGNLEASFQYVSGLLEGENRLYFPSGQLKGIRPYRSGQLHGEVKSFDLEGNCIQKQNYNKGKKDGAANQYWNRKILASDELFSNGKLLSGLYFNPLGKLLGQVKKGFGFKAIWSDDQSYNLVEYAHGLEDGLVRIYDLNEKLTHEYTQHAGAKDGKEVLYFENTSTPKLCINWKQGRIHGTITSWYPNGTIESEREMSQNKKHGILSARYENSDLMLIEEYDRGLLVKGKYFKKGSSHPCSSVSSGQGEAHLFDSKGILIQKVQYQGGKPLE